MSKIRALITEIHRRSLWQVLGIYAVGSWVVYQVVLGVFEGLGLPDWVPPTALLLLLVGLPIVLATAFVQEGGPRPDRSGPADDVGSAGGARGPASDAIEGPTLAGASLDPAPAAASVRVTDRRAPAAPRSARVFTWHRAITAGVLAFATLGLAASGFMGMRALGIGPAATLVSSGVLDAREPVLLADFESASGDSVLASAVTDALRVDLETSPIVTLVQSAHVQDALGRMQRDPAARLTSPVATEVALREGIRAILVGDVTSAGGQVVLTARLIAPDGAALASVRETAAPDAVIEAADRLSAALRARLGESFKSIRAAEPLAQVTTPSLEALRKYSQGALAFSTGADPRKSIVLLQEALAHDTAFAMAWRKLSVAYQLVNRDSMLAAATQAYRHRDRLTDRERYLTEGTYFNLVESDTARAMVAYEALLDVYPDDETALHNLALLHSMRGDEDRAAELYTRALEVAPRMGVTYRNLVRVLASLRRWDQADTLLVRYETLFPDHYQAPQLRGALAAARFRYDEALPLLTRATEMSGTDAGAYELRSVLFVQGRHARALELERAARGGLPAEAVEANTAFTEAALLGLHRFDVDAAVDRYERYATPARLAAMPAAERPYLELLLLNVFAGRVDRAERILQQWRSARPENFRTRDGQSLTAEVELAAARGQPEQAILEYRRRAADDCLECWVHLGRMYEAAGKADSAIVAYETYLDPPRGVLYRVNVDRLWLPGVLQRLARLHEAAGNEDAAARHWTRLLELWAEADPELQPQVAATRAALERLAAER
jgi:eukaryotic-like serine/threonine-protein kinase